MRKEYLKINNLFEGMDNDYSKISKPTIYNADSLASELTEQLGVFVPPMVVERTLRNYHLSKQINRPTAKSGNSTSEVKNVVSSGEFSPTLNIDNSVSEQLVKAVIVLVVVCVVQAFVIGLLLV